MTFGFPAYHEASFETPLPLTDGWIAHVCGVLGWAFKGAVQRVPYGKVWRIEESLSMSSWGCNIEVRMVGPARVHVRSECALPTQCVDWGKNARNVRALETALLAEMQKDARERR